MPSQSYRTFRKNQNDVFRLIRDYNKLNTDIGTKGRRALDHLTRSGVILLAGAWELYVEDLLAESANFLSTISAHDFPVVVKQQIHSYIKSHKNDIKSLDLVGEGWKKVYKEEIVQKQIDLLNTPKREKIDNLYKNLLGIGMLSDSWSDKDFIDEFVKTRGEIAHRIKAKEYVKVQSLEEYLNKLIVIVKETDNFVLEYIKGYIGVQPWNKIS